MTIGDGGNGVQLGLKGSNPLGLDGGFLHETRIEIADFAGVGGRGRTGFRRILDQGKCTLARFIGQDGVEAVAGFIGGNGRRFDPSAIGIRVEIVAGRDGGVHSREIEVRILQLPLGTSRHCKKNYAEQQGR